MIYLVKTFPAEPHERDKQPRAYLRYYDPAWEGCKEYWVRAKSGAEAKRVAIKIRMEEDADDA